MVSGLGHVLLSRSRSFHGLECLGLGICIDMSRSMPFISFGCTKLSIMCEIQRGREINT
jgi:hypothetical protein